MRRIGVLALAIVALGVAAAASPRVTVSREIYDFGAAMDGAVIEFPVVITNTGTSTLNISSVSYNCSCTGYQLPKRILAPGEAVTMTVTFRTAGYSRYPQPVSQTLTINSNDPTRPQLPVTVRGVVRTMGAHEGAAATLEAEFYLLVDLRPAQAYAQGHLMGAINIPFADLGTRMNELPRTRVVYLYDETGIESVQAAQMMQQAGFLLPRAMRGGLLQWWQLHGDLFFSWASGAARTAPAGTPYYGTFSVVDASRIAQNYLYIVDVRSPEAFAQGRFLGSVNVQLGTQDQIAAWAATLPRQAPNTALAIWVVDEDGSRTCSIAQYLQGLGFARARCLFGGVNGWRASHGDTLLFPLP